MTLRPRDRIAIAVVLFFAVMGAYYLLALKPEREKASTIATAIAGQRTALAGAQATYAAGKAAQASVKAGAPELAALRTAVPTTSNIPALLRILERNADAVHVKMQAITLGGASTSTGASPSITSSAGAATSVPIALTFAGGYTELNTLVRRLVGLVVVSGNSVHATGPLLSISNVSLTGAPKLTVQLTAAIYQLSAPLATGAATTGGQ